MGLPIAALYCQANLFLLVLLRVQGLGLGDAVALCVAASPVLGKRRAPVLVGFHCVLQPLEEKREVRTGSRTSGG